MIRKALRRWLDGGEAPRRDLEQSITQVVGRDAALALTPYGANERQRDRPIGYTVAPPASRQTWELHRVREESRNLYLTSPIWHAYVTFQRVQVRGWHPSRLQWRRFTREQKRRLKQVTKFLSADWERFQVIRGVCTGNRSVHQLAGSVLHHVDVDGDCFLTKRMVNGRRVWDLHPGDALVESSSQQMQQGRWLRMGVETDPHGMPVAYHFANRGELARMAFGYYAQGSNTDVLRMPAQSVQHIRDLSSEVSVTRGWPRWAPVIEDIARLDEWYSALVRSAISRAAISIVLEKQGWVGDPGALKGDKSESPMAQLARAQGIGGDEELSEDAREVAVQRYREFLNRSGGVLELDAGFKPHALSTGSPTAEEAKSIVMIERRVCAALRTTPTALLGDYASISFSAIQGSNVQDREAINDKQTMLEQGCLLPIFRDRARMQAMRLQRQFPEIDKQDWDALLNPEIVLRSYVVIDKQRLIKPLLDSFDKGVLTWSEMREELGYFASDPEAVIEEWKENRRMLGLPDTPTAAQQPPVNGGGDSEPDEDDDEDDDE